ncbi:hypothetical protein HFO07_30480 [Rhizobium leguminosarum]|uniref:hypothetical protein n=1 Tax=Rhizobium leguminosarum TaxID=384 RepID=UPI001C96C4E4|nr:hypothetical protein [Rhizobium leguminosarum]MBY5760922.1 hypothetical protein [Rhizobium leguminosarum]
MNMQINVAEIQRSRMPRTPSIRHLLNAHTAIETLAAQLAPMPDCAMDSLMNAAHGVREDVLEMAALSPADIADKFRLLADLIDRHAGEHVHEFPLLQDAIGDLVLFRTAQMRADLDQPHPIYDRPEITGFVFGI